MRKNDILKQKNLTKKRNKFGCSTRFYHPNKNYQEEIRHHFCNKKPL